jgi:hypothetical protein
MRNYHASRRFEIVAVDVVEISQTAVDGAKKALVICDQFTRFVVVVPIDDESAVTVARELLQLWSLLFGPPERLLSDNGANFCGKIIRHLCAATGIKEVFTTPWHPHTDGTVERFNRTLCPVLAKVVLREEDWSQHVPMAAFRYNSPYHSTTGMTPYRGMFGVDYFDFDAGTGLAFRLQDETQAKDLPARLAAAHADLLPAGRLSRDRAARYYDAAVKETVYKVGDTVVVFNPPGVTEVGRKLHAPWLGPYKISERLSPVRYILESLLGGKRVRAHVNRLRHFDVVKHRKTGDPVEAMWPDSRRILQGIMAEREDKPGTFKVRFAGRRGFKEVKETDLRTVAVVACSDGAFNSSSRRGEREGLWCAEDPCVKTTACVDVGQR